MNSRPDPRAHDPGSVPARIIVGVVSDQPAEVIATAANFATHFDAELICAHVDDSRYTVETRADGTVLSVPLDPDTTAEANAEFDSDLHTRIASALAGSRIEWSTRVLAGAPAVELDHLAETVDARMIVVGVRRAGIRGSLHEFLNGSVAVQLSHHQHRPLVVVPLRDRAAGGTAGEAAGGTVGRVRNAEAEEA